MLTPNRVLAALRLMALVCGAAMVGLLLGPFQGLERQFGLSDQAAHVIAAFAVTLGLFTVAPRWRRLDIALVVVVLGGAVEVAQGFTGRSLSLSDVVSDAAGVVVALVPGYIEQFRRYVQRFPNESFGSIRRRDRRRDRSRSTKGVGQVERPPVSGV